MKKLAIFVEGYTEVIFLERLLPEICGAHNIVVEHKAIRGGGKSGVTPRTLSIVKAAKEITDEKYYILIVDCGGDRLVASKIIEEHESLTKAGYSKIIGIRDLRPDFTIADIPRLEISLRKYIKTKLIPVDFILSIAEIESWFLAEFNHFEEIDPTLTINLIKINLGFDPSSDDMQLRSEPQSDLNNCYELVGKKYIKSDELTVDALDYDHIYITVQNRIPHLKKLISNIESFLT